MSLSRLVNNFNSLTEVEQKIAESIIKSPELYTNRSANDVADGLFVSKTSIINFAQKMGFEGFSELRYYIQSSLIGDNHRHLSTFDEINTHLYREVEKTFELVREEDLITFIKNLKNAKTIYILARGITKQYATAFALQLRMLDIIAIFVDDYNLIKTLPNTLKAEDTCVILSLSGKTDILVEFTNRALARNSKIMSITSFGNNPINQMSDYTLHFYSETEVQKYRDLDSRMGLNIVLQQIIEYLKLDR